MYEKSFSEGCFFTRFFCIGPQCFVYSYLRLLPKFVIIEIRKVKKDDLLLKLEEEIKSLEKKNLVMEKKAKE